MADQPTAPHDLCLNCPHCGNRIRVVEPDPREVQCTSCGSSFKLDPNATDAHRPADLPTTLGRFVVIERLGGGSFGTVYKATDPGLDRTVAVKVPRVGSFASVEERARFVREAKAAARLTHPGIVAVYEVAADADPPLIVSEFVDGPTLADRLTAGKPPPREAAGLVAALAVALDYAHRNGVVHRDVKPGNILLAGGSVPKLADFGLARRDDPAEIVVTRAGEVLGTPAYMAPEQAAGRSDADGRADVYSLGVVLYELLTGVLPFRGNSRMLLHQVLHDDPPPPRRVNDTVPRDLETITLMAMAKLPAKRYATAGELAADLRRYLEGRPITARPPGRTEKAAKWVRRNPTVAALTAAVVLALTAGVAVSGYFAATWKQTAGELDTELRLSRKKEGEAAVERGLLRCDQKEEKEGLLWLARGLELMAANGATDDEQWHVRMQMSLWGQHLTPRWTSLEGATQKRFDVRAKGVFANDARSVFLFANIPTHGRVVRQYDSSSGRVIATYQGPEGQRPGISPTTAWVVDKIVLSNDGSRVLVTYRLEGDIRDYYEVRVWDARSGQIEGTIEFANTVHYHHPQWTPDLRLVLGFEGSERSGHWSVWEPASARRLCAIPAVDVTPHNDPTYHFIHFDDRRLAYKTNRSPACIRLIDVRTGRTVADLPHSTPRESVEVIGFGNRGRDLLTRGTENRVFWWDADTGRKIGERTIRPDLGPNLYFTKDRMWLIVGDAEFGFRVKHAFDAKTGEPFPYPLVDPDTITPDGSAGVKEGDWLVELSTGRMIGRPFPNGSILAFAAGSQVLLLEDGYGTTSVHKSSGREIGTQVRSKLASFDRLRDRLYSVVDTGTPLEDTVSLTHTILTPLDAAPERITLWAETLTGMTLDAAGTPVPLAADAVAERKVRLDALGGSPLPPRP